VTKEFEGKLKAWIWIAVSVGVMMATYTALYWKEIFSTLQHSPDYIQKFNIHGVAQVFWRSILFLRYYIQGCFRFVFSRAGLIILLPFLITCAGIVVGIWAALTCRVDIMGGVGIATGVVMVVAAVAALVSRVGRVNSVLSVQQ
jgi:hypothetical protein